MCEPNLGFLYYKDYYRDENNEYYRDANKEYCFDKSKQNIIAHNKMITDTKLTAGLCSSQIPQGLAKQCFRLKTTYPGLLVGTGYSHGIGEDDFKMGFSFDYTGGLPEIPGSSVKGILRSPFSDMMNEEDGHYEYIKSLLSTLDIAWNQKKVTSIMDIRIRIRMLEQEIFDGIEMENGVAKQKPMSKRDVFFSAVIDYDATCKINKNENENENGNILGEDYITPHPDKFQNPIPIKILRILPNIVFRFQFKLKDGLISVKDKQKLFKQIILDLGVGAKTNVGYGYLKELKE